MTVHVLTPDKFAMDILVIISFVCFLTGFFLLWRIPVCRSGEDAKGSLDDVSVIIPARDEAHNLPKLFSSLKKQPQQPAEILVINDQSRDATAEIAEKSGARVVSIKEKPDGWNGKSYACWQGANTASGKILVFLDADTQLETGGLEKMVSSFRRVGGLLSIQPYHSVADWYEKLSEVLNIMVMAGFNVFTPLGHKWKPPGSFGPCIVCSRQSYFLTGGHEAVKSERLEDIPFGRNFSNKGFAVHCYGGQGTISFRMYPNGLRESIQGWSKSFAIGSSSTHPAAMILAIAWISGLAMAAIGLFSPSLAGVLLYAGFVYQLHWMGKRIGSFGFLPALVFPLPLMFFLYIYTYSFINSFLRKQITWKGRTLMRD